LGRKAVWAGYCCGDQTGAEMESAGKEIFLSRKKIIENNLGCYSLDKKLLNF
jgi:hypothetical protein